MSQDRVRITDGYRDPICSGMRPAPVSRRQMLQTCAGGFGALALQALLNDPAYGATLLPGGKSDDDQDAQDGNNALHGTHFSPKAKNVIFLYMDGGPSQVDTFDPKPLLTKYNGKDPGKHFKVEATQFNNNGKLLGSLWKFRKYGQSGIEVSDLFPHVAKCVDDLAVVRSMVSEFPEHTFANYFLHTGSGLQGRPSMGAWVNYGLGSECKNLPGFVAVNGGLIPPGGLDCFGSGFLPASYQGSVFKPAGSAVANIKSSDRNGRQRKKLDLLKELDQSVLQRYGKHDNLESAISNYELAFQMQSAVPDLMKFNDEPEHIRKMYGLDSKFGPTKTFGAECLLARRLVQRGVRFIELTCPAVKADRWDQHNDLKNGHERNAKAVDQPIAGLLKDLKQQGMLDSTLVVWAGEFGRTPFAQGKNGRDHNPFGFTIWMAGGGVKPGTVYGSTDEFGYKAIENRVEIHDLHATMLHLLGVDHERSTFRFGGRDMRLTDVKGHVVKDIVG